jgi:SulP family sulfate permease
MNWCEPAGALTGILSKNSIRYGVEVLPLLAIISGVLCLGVFAIKLDQCVQFVPLSVVQGFSVGVAFSIAANQLDFALGLPKCVFPLS